MRPSFDGISLAVCIRRKGSHTVIGWLPHLLRVPADADAAAFARRHRGAGREPAGDAFAGRQGLPDLFECGVDVDRQIEDTVGGFRRRSRCLMSASWPVAVSAERAGTAG